MPNVIGSEAYQSDRRAAAGRGEGRFYTRVTGPNDKNINHRGDVPSRHGQNKAVSRETSLTEAEFSEYAIEHCVDTILTLKPSKRSPAFTQLFGKEDGVVATL